MKSVPIARLGEDLETTLRANGAPPKTLSNVRLVVRVLATMLGEQATSDALVFTPEFVGRFLATWGGSTRHNTVVSMLGVLGVVGTFALDRGALEASGFDRRPIPIPPEWDEDHPSFLGTVATPRSVATDQGPVPTWDEVLALTAHLKDPKLSGPWIGGRFFVLYANVVLGGLQVAEALAIEDDDFRDGRKLRIPMRERIRRSRRVGPGESFAEVELCGTLYAINDRWRDRNRMPSCPSRWLLPNLARTGPCAPNACGPFGGWFSADLDAACKAAGIRPLTFRGLARFREDSAFAASLADPARSPFRLEPGDGVLALAPVPLDALEAETVTYYGEPGRTTLYELKELFKALRRAGVSASIELGVPGIDERLASAIAGDGSEKTAQRLKWLRTACAKAVELGRLDLDPFAGRRDKGGGRRGPRADGPRPHRRLASLARAVGFEPTTIQPIVNPTPSASHDQVQAELSKLTVKQAKVARVLIATEPLGLTGDAIRVASQVSGWWKILKAIKESGPFWEPKVIFPTAGKTHYRIKTT
jgi:hypothetical protein